MTVQIDRTAEVLADMFVENTGTHMLDSGGAYGRNWQRNQGMTAEDFETTPLVKVEPWGDDSFTLTVDAYLFLNECLEFDEDLQAEFDSFADERPDDAWPTLMESFTDFLEDRGELVSGPLGEGSPITVNTYNGEDALSQVLQYTLFTLDDEEFVLLQVHGGADVRGGYTAPKVFRHYDGGCWAIWDNARISAWTDYEESDDPRLFEVPDVPRKWWQSEDAGYTFWESGYGQDTAEWKMVDGKVIYEPWGTEVHFGI